MKNKIATLISVLSLLLLLQVPVFAQEEAQGGENLKGKVSNLVFIKKNIAYLQDEIKRLQKNVDSEVSKDLKAELQNELAGVRKRYKNSRRSFSETATGVRLGPLEERGKKRKLLDEAQELLAPLLDTFRRISERPRKIERLKTEISDGKEKIILTEKALSNLEKLIQFKENSEVLDNLIKVKEDTQGMLQGLQINLESSERELQQETGTDKSFILIATEVTKHFFRNRGKNLILSIASFFCIWWVLSAIRSRIFKSDIFSTPLAWIKKPLKALYNLIAVSLAVIGTLICLYLLNDWVLLTFVVLILSTIAWTSRQWIPKFVQEGRIILNLGTVREGERIIWQGVPFLVRDLGFYSTIVNEQLEGGYIKVAAAEFIGMHTRPVVKDEPWFPTSKGDWALLSDDTYGQILTQTPEQVIIHEVQTLGGTHKYYPTAEFIAQKPRNLSIGFCLVVEFGLDYGVKSRICNEIPEIFIKGIQSRLSNRLSGDDPDFKDLRVEFHNVGESELNLWVKTDCPGRMAHLYLDLERELQKTLVDICNEHNLTIPFKQLKIHGSGKEKL